MLGTLAVFHASVPTLSCTQVLPLYFREGGTYSHAPKLTSNNGRTGGQKSSQGRRLYCEPVLPCYLGGERCLRVVSR